MRKPLALLSLFLAISCAAPAFAALTVITGPAETNNGTPFTATFTGSVGTGQVMLVFFQGFTTPTVSDNVNTGNYSLLASYSTPQLSLYYKVTNASNAGSTTVTVTGTGYVFVWMMAVTGFAGTPTIDATLGQPTATATSGTAALNMSSNFPNEILLMNVGGASKGPLTSNVTVTGWSPGTAPPSALVSAFYAIKATPTANNFSGTLTSQQWYLQGAGIYDSAGAPANSNQPLSLTGVSGLFSAPAANDPHMAMDRLILPRFKKVA